MSKNRKPDPVSVQVSLAVRVPKGTAVSKKALNDAYLQWIETGNLPPGISIRGIFWRNPARKGALSEWRWSSGSRKDALIPNYYRMTIEEKAAARAAIGGIEDSPRGDHDEARSTLSEALRLFRPF